MCDHFTEQCVLAVMGEIVAKVLSREDLDDAGNDFSDFNLL